MSRRGAAQEERYPFPSTLVPLPPACQMPRAPDADQTRRELSLWGQGCIPAGGGCGHWPPTGTWTPEAARYAHGPPWALGTHWHPVIAQWGWHWSRSHHPPLHWKYPSGAAGASRLAGTWSRTALIRRASRQETRLLQHRDQGAPKIPEIRFKAFFMPNGAAKDQPEKCVLIYLLLFLVF